MKKILYLLSIGLLFTLLGCSSPTTTPVKENANASTPKITQPEVTAVVDYVSVARNFLNQKNLKILVNSEAGEDIQLPSDFKTVKNGINVGDLLKQRNELSKQNNLEFSKYMGQKVKMYTAAIETGDSKLYYEVVLFIAENKVVGYWIDAGMKDPKQNRPDFNVLVNLLISR